MSEDRVEYGTYAGFLSDIKTRLKTARIRAHLSANRELLELYWDIGRMIVERQNLEGWGSAVIKQLSGDVRREFQDLKGFSEHNIWRMKSFYLAYVDHASSCRSCRDYFLGVLGLRKCIGAWRRVHRGGE